MFLPHSAYPLSQQLKRHCPRVTKIPCCLSVPTHQSIQIEPTTTITAHLLYDLHWSDNRKSQSIANTPTWKHRCYPAIDIVPAAARDCPPRTTHSTADPPYRKYYGKTVQYRVQYGLEDGCRRWQAGATTWLVARQRSTIDTHLGWLD